MHWRFQLSVFLMQILLAVLPGHICMATPGFEPISEERLQAEFAPFAATVVQVHTFCELEVEFEGRRRRVQIAGVMSNQDLATAKARPTDHRVPASLLDRFDKNRHVARNYLATVVKPGQTVYLLDIASSKDGSHLVAKVRIPLRLPGGYMFFSLEDDLLWAGYAIPPSPDSAATTSRREESIRLLRIASRTKKTGLWADGSFGSAIERYRSVHADVPIPEEANPEFVVPLPCVYIGPGGGPWMPPRHSQAALMLVCSDRSSTEAAIAESSWINSKLELIGRSYSDKELVAPTARQQLEQALTEAVKQHMKEVANGSVSPQVIVRHLYAAP